MSVALRTIPPARMSDEPTLPPVAIPPEWRAAFDLVDMQTTSMRSTFTHLYTTDGRLAGIPAQVAELEARVAALRQIIEAI